MIETQDSLAPAPPMHLTESETVGIVLPSATSGDADAQELIIRPRSGWIGIDWREMWSCRELLGFLIWRESSVRYKQTVLGPAWAIFQPMITMAIFSVIFGRFAKMPSE